MATSRERQRTKSGGQRVLRPGEGSTETVDHGKQASQLRWEVGERVGRRKVESWGGGSSGTGRHNERKKSELKPESQLKHSSPNLHFSSNSYASSH